jgi:hypothetical protein
MSRDPLHNVTLPILVDADSTEQADGWGTCFPAANRTKLMAVRVVNAGEIKRRLLKIFSSKEVSRTNEKFLYLGAGLLNRAYEAKDEWALQEALKQVHPWIPRISGKESVNPDADKREGARWDYSSLMSNALQDARLVMWWPWPEQGQRFASPAVYCPNWKTAAFVAMFMEYIRVCPNPKCNRPFIPKTDNQDYCIPAHGVAYRTALSRWRKKQRADGQKKKARKSLR